MLSTRVVGQAQLAGAKISGRPLRDARAGGVEELELLVLNPAALFWISGVWSTPSAPVQGKVVALPAVSSSSSMRTSPQQCTFPYSQLQADRMKVGTGSQLWFLVEPLRLELQPDLPALLLPVSALRLELMVDTVVVEDGLDGALGCCCG